MNLVNFAAQFRDLGSNDMMFWHSFISKKLMLGQGRSQRADRLGAEIGNSHLLQRVHGTGSEPRSSSPQELLFSLSQSQAHLGFDDR